ncbi:MAG: hypothetical protein B6D59_01980 [Campylobacteraceae bacterium 4484_4]|nr:MAG: hypothetical protein B6D59_01980 [Campylobacteraceae bacterium 4484_4]
MIQRFFVALFLLVTLGNAEEPSAFGGGLSQGANPYGLNETEKLIIENKRTSLSNKRQIKSLKLEIENLKEQLEGLRSVVEGMGQKIGKTDKKIADLQQKKPESSTDTVSLQEQIDALKKQQQQQYEKIEKVLQKLGAMIDDLAAKKSALSSKPVKKKRKTAKKTNAQLLKEAIAKYRAKKYDEAFKLFDTLQKAEYKPAQATYYMGEISYYQKHYTDAIFYFKKSVEYYDKASYMPTLLLHTAISFEKIKDQENARRFFNALIDSYPETKQAAMAKKHLK